MPTLASTALRLGVVLLWALTHVARADECSDKYGASSPERAHCAAALADAQEAQLEAYLNAAESQAKADAKGSGKPPIDLRKAQQAWEAYRTAQCGDVYLFWLDGSYRYEAVFACNQQLTRERMHDLWSAYLKLPGGGPARLPEP